MENEKINILPVSRFQEGWGVVLLLSICPDSRIYMN